MDRPNVAVPLSQVPEMVSVTESPVPMGIATAHHLKSNYVPFPLPSGIQNYILVASKDPGMALSQLYDSAQKPVTFVNPEDMNPGGFRTPSIYGGSPVRSFDGLLSADSPQQPNAQLTGNGGLQQAFFNYLSKSRPQLSAPAYLTNLHQMSYATAEPNPKRFETTTQYSAPSSNTTTN